LLFFVKKYLFINIFF